jgi:hypothetical protein
MHPLDIIDLLKNLTWLERIRFLLVMIFRLTDQETQITLSHRDFTQSCDRFPDC